MKDHETVIVKRLRQRYQRLIDQHFRLEEEAFRRTPFSEKIPVYLITLTFLAGLFILVYFIGRLILAYF